MCVSVVCGAQVSFQQPDLERGGWVIRGTRQPAVPVSVGCCAVPVLRMCGEVMMLWRMRDGVFPSPFVCLLCAARRSLSNNQISGVEAGLFAGLGNLRDL
jgi:hypothetical protein